VNYSTLFSTVKAYAENDFPTTQGSGGLTSTEQIDTFIKQAEQRVYHAVQILDLRKNVTGSTTTSNRYLSVPTDWVANFSLAIVDPTSGEYDYLLNKDVNFIHEAFPVPTDTGKPTHYASFDKDTYILGPTPDAEYVAELYYFYIPETIVTATNTWLGDNFDSVLLYGALLEAAAFMKSDEDILAKYQERYGEAMALLKELCEGKNRQDMYRTPQVRYPVK
jgi:hypothetical protein|tara:strand:- start:2572 stop:3234 length:663 start_codon:yes stop_codon:yes gene_type:complete